MPENHAQKIDQLSDLHLADLHGILQTLHNNKPSS